MTSKASFPSGAACHRAADGSMIVVGQGEWFWSPDGVAFVQTSHLDRGFTMGPVEPGSETMELTSQGSFTDPLTGVTREYTRTQLRNDYERTSSIDVEGTAYEPCEMPVDVTITPLPRNHGREHLPKVSATELRKLAIDLEADMNAHSRAVAGLRAVAQFQFSHDNREVMGELWSGVYELWPEVEGRLVAGTLSLAQLSDHTTLLEHSSFDFRSLGSEAVRVLAFDLMLDDRWIYCVVMDPGASRAFYDRKSDQEKTEFLAAAALRRTTGTGMRESGNAPVPVRPWSGPFVCALVGFDDNTYRVEHVMDGHWLEGLQIAGRGGASVTF